MIKLQCDYHPATLTKLNWDLTKENVFFYLISFIDNSKYSYTEFDASKVARK